MLLDKQNGISCDGCRTIYIDDFKYYSYDFRKIIVTHNIVPQFRYNTPADMSMDICEPCNEKFKTLVLKNHKPTPTLPTRNYHKGIYCEFTSKKLINDYIFYHCNVSEIIVKLSNKKYKCINCKNDILDHTQPCPTCSNSKFHKAADIKVDDKIFEIWICEEAYTQLYNTTKSELRKEQSKWSSSAE